MSEPICPIAKKIYVCDDVTRNPESGKVTLLNLWDSVRIPEGGKFPYSLEKMCIFAWLRDGLGHPKIRVDLVQASTGELIRRTQEFPVRFDSKPCSVFASFRIPNCEFPRPGFYYVEVYCEGEFVDDQIIRVIAAEEDL